MTVPPRSALIFSSLLTLAVALFMVALALSTPRLGIQWKEGPENTLMVANVSAGTSAMLTPPGTVITHFVTPDGALLAEPRLIVEEPDTLMDYTEFNRFMQDQKPLAAALKSDSLQLRLADGRHIPVHTRAARLSDLPFLFWFQIFVGAAGAFTGVLVWMLGEKNRATLLYAFTGLGYLIFAPTAAVYSTRELAMDATTFQLLSTANHFGALFFAASLSALQWYYPRPLGKFPAATLCYVIAFSCWLLDTAQFFNTSIILHISTLTIFSISIVFAVMQWRRTKDRPADRAALRWFLLSIYLGTNLFVFTIIVPAAMNWPLPASQGVMFGAFLIMYWGIALGVVRYRLFQLEEWWHSIWTWFASGVAVIVLDITLVSFLSVDAPLALILSAAIIGWIYFPMRQWLWKKMGKHQGISLQKWLPSVLPYLIRPAEGDNPEQNFLARWPEIVRLVFTPSSVENSDGTPGILEDGLAMRIPGITRHSNSLLLRHAAQGARLFSHQDLETIQALRQIFNSAYDIQKALKNSTNHEHWRINRDISEDITPRLRSLLATCKEENRSLVRDLLAHTKDLTNTISQTSLFLTTALSQWRIELREACEKTAVTLNWSSQGNEDGMFMLSARQHVNLDHILREASQLALQESRTKQLTIHLTCRDTQQLHLHLHSDGLIAPTKQSSSSQPAAYRSIRERAEELGGAVLFNFEKGFTVEVTLPPADR